jgi:methylenetetrahydrofolate dehydrogenase (NADP+)/methenyltetrahydrofolate cyclohydrolase
MAERLNGKVVADKMIETLKTQLLELQSHTLMTPQLTVVQVGSDPASQVYVANKQKACEKAGFLSEKVHLDESVSEQELISLIQKLNESDKVNGIIVQLPLPAHISEKNVLDAINPLKDVDGFHPSNIGKLLQKRPLFRSCTPLGIMKLLENYQLSLEGKEVVIVGASNIVGRPMLVEALNAQATVTCCHSKTQDLKAHARRADVLIMATGRRGLLDKEDFKEDAIVIDVGIHRLDDGTLCGDLDYDNISDKVAYMTPVPGGVGPLTVSCLLANTFKAFVLQNQLG